MQPGAINLKGLQAFRKLHDRFQMPLILILMMSLIVKALITDYYSISPTL